MQHAQNTSTPTQFDLRQESLEKVLGSVQWERLKTIKDPSDKEKVCNYLARYGGKDLSRISERG